MLHGHPLASRKPSHVVGEALAALGLVHARDGRARSRVDPINFYRYGARVDAPDVKRALLILYVLLGCAVSDDTQNPTTLGAGTETATGADAGSSDGAALDETGPCDPGTQGCTCAEGTKCINPFICVAGFCTTPPNPGDDGTPSDDGPDDTGSADTGSGSDGAPESCLSSENCPAPLACSTDGLCVDARDLAYEVTVPTWAPSTCDGGTLDGDADLFWELRIGGATVGSSTWMQGGCPGVWRETVCVEQGGMHEPWFLVLWDEDGAEDDLMDSLWWDDDGNTLADPIDPIWLHLGGYDGTTGSGGHVRVEFGVVPFCP